jgi:hypothetical protein
MRWGIRALVCASAAALVAVAVRRGPPTAEAPLEPPPAPPDPAALAVDTGPGLRYLGDRLRRKVAVARDLAEGRASLWQAAARMRDLDRAMPPLMHDPWARPWLRRPVPEDERCCRDILHLAHIEYDDRPGCRELLDLWDCELEACVAEGSLRLPE